MKNLVTATGKMYQCDYFNLSDLTNQGDIRLLGMSVVDVVSVFTDPAETSKLRCGVDMAEGFTEFLGLRIEGAAIRVILGKE